MNTQFQGYDVKVDNAETDQQMCTPMLVSRFGPEIKTVERSIKEKNNKLGMDWHA